MKIKKIFLTCIMTTSFFSAVEAASISSDVCANIPGHWHGIYTIKDQNRCKQLNGCTHLVMAEASHVAGNEYHISLNPVVGNGGEFNIKCDNGVITSPMNPGNVVTLSCNANGYCFVKYDDPMLSSEMLKG